MKIQLKIPNIASNSYYKNNIENFNQLKTIVENFPKNWNKKIHMKTNQSLLKWINDITPLLNDKFFTLKTKIYWILYDIKTFPLCKQCKKPLNHWNVKTLTSPYANFCSQKCRANNKDTQLKKEQTCKKLYGAKSIMQSEYGKRQYKNAMLKTYGVDNPQKVPSIRQKTNATCQTLFGGNAPICLQSIKSQIQQTNNDTYGGICPMKSKDVVKKLSQTYYKNTGYNWPGQNPSVQKKIHKKYTYNGINFNSAPEIAFYIYCKDNNIKCLYEFESAVLTYIDKLNVQHTYIPDFYLPDQNIRVEIKGDNHFDKKTGKMIYISNRKKDYIAEAKYQCMINNNVLILRSKDYNFFITYVMKKYGKNYISQFRNKL